MKSLPDKKWSCLSSVKTWLETNRKTEKIVEFQGWYILTKKALYTLFDGQLIVRDPVKPPELPPGPLRPKLAKMETDDEESIVRGTSNDERKTRSTKRKSPTKSTKAKAKAKTKVRAKKKTS